MSETMICRKCGERRQITKFRARVAQLNGGRERHYRERTCKPCQAARKKQRVIEQKSSRPTGPIGVHKIFFCKVRPTWT